MRSKYLFYLLILLLPVQLGKHFWPTFSFVNGLRIDYLAPTIYLTDVIVLGIVITWLVEKFKDQRSNPPAERAGFKTKIKILKFTVYCLLFAVYSILFAHNQPLALFKSLKIIEFSLLVLFIIKERPSFKITVYCLLFTIFYSSLIAWGQFVKQSSLNGIFYFLGERTFNISTPGIARADIFGKLILRPYATFPHPNVLAGFLTVLLPFIIFLPEIVKIKIQKLTLYFPLLFLTLATIFITFSRTAWIASILIISAVMLFKIKRKRFLSFFFLFTIYGLLFTVFPISANRLQSIFTTDQESFLIRQKLTLISFEMIKKHPFFGVGLNNFIPQINSYSAVNSYQELQPVHNIYLLIGVEGGVYGLLLFSVIIVTLFRKLLNSKFETRNSNLDIRILLLISLTAILFLSLFDHYFFTLQQAQLLFTVIIGFILSISQMSKIRD